MDRNHTLVMTCPKVKGVEAVAWIQVVNIELVLVWRMRLYNIRCRLSLSGLHFDYDVGHGSVSPTLDKF